MKGVSKGNRRRLLELIGRSWNAKDKNCDLLKALEAGKECLPGVTASGLKWLQSLGQENEGLIDPPNEWIAWIESSRDVNEPQQKKQRNGNNFIMTKQRKLSYVRRCILHMSSSYQSQELQGCHLAEIASCCAE